MFNFSGKKKETEDGEPKPKSVPFHKLFRYADSKDVICIILGSICAAATGCGWPLISIIFGDMTDSFVTIGREDPGGGSANATTAAPSLDMDGFIRMMDDFCLKYTYIGLGIFAGAYGQIYFWSVACERQVHRLRKAFFKAVLRQEMSWLDKHASGELTTRLADDLDKIRDGLGDKTSQIVQAFAGFLCGFIIGFIKSWKMTLVMMSMTPLMAIGMGFVGKMMSNFSEQEQKAYAKAGAVAEETISCMKTVIMFCGQEEQERRYAEELKGSRREGIKKSITSGVGFGFFMLVMFSAYCLSFWFGATQVKLFTETAGADGISPGNIFTVFFCVLIGSMSIGMAGQPFSTVATAAGAATVIFEIIDNEPKIDASKEEGKRLDKVEGTLSFHDVHFKYPTREDVPVLQGVNLSVKPGQTVALTGPSGCGKSSIVKLLLRFYDPDSGSVQMDGCSLQEFNVHWYRDHIGIVSQEPILFSCSIMDNIKLGREDVTNEEVIAAATKANAHKFISKLPARYDTLVGERGAQLSGGQKQRIAIARALVKNPVLLLLDEATSALDSASEKSVQKALDEAGKDRTTIVIAHRLSTIRNADVILSISEGQVVESGTHDELMAMKGQYYQLTTLQEIKQAQEKETLEELDGKNNMETVDLESNGNAAPSRTRKVSISSPQKKYLFENQMSVVSDSGSATTKTSELKRRQSTSSQKDGKLTVEEKQELKQAPGFFAILKMNTPEWPYIVMACVGSALLGGSMPVFSVFFADVITVFTKYSGDEMVREATNVALLFLILGGSEFMGQILANTGLGFSGERLTFRLRDRTFRAIMRQDMSYFEDPKNSIGAVTTRLATDASTVKGATGVRISVPIQALVGIVVGMVISLYFGWKLALFILACAPLMGIAGFVEMKYHTSKQSEDDELSQQAGKTSAETIENLSTVQALGRENTFYERYAGYLERPYRRRLCKAFLSALTFAFSQSVIFFIYAAAFRFGAYLVSINDMEVGNVFKVFFAIAFTGMTIGQVSSLVPDYARARIAAFRIMQILNSTPAIDNSSTEGERPGSISGDISVSKAFFHYPARPDAQVLQGVDVTVKAGQTVALVGPSGCGKSTIICLLERLYDPVSGSVCLDGRDLRNVNVKWLRQNVRIVSQEPVLFARSIRDNIIFGLDGPVTDEMIVAVAKQSNIHDFIESLPDGYDTDVGEKGAQLSGGQKQRVALARALITRPQILLLDEATSALDTESEAVVQAALEEAREGRTCILIAHRLSTVQNSDLIVVMEAGKVVEQGTHQQLMAEGGAYYALATGHQDEPQKK